MQQTFIMFGCILPPVGQTLVVLDLTMQFVAEDSDGNEVTGSAEGASLMKRNVFQGYKCIYILPQR